jgi:cancer susceptibility candidate protein 1
MNTDSLMEEKQAEVSKKITEGPQKGYKQDEKHKQEIFKVYQPLPDIRFGLWINPNSKSGYRHKPIDFQELEVQMEVPRPLMSTMLIMKVVWTGFDHLSDWSYSKDITVGGVLDIECLEFLPLPRKVNTLTLKQSYDINEALKKYSYPALDSNGQVNY